MYKFLKSALQNAGIISTNYPSNIINSNVQYIELIDPSAIVKDATLYGDVIIHDNAKVINAHLSGSIEIGSYSSINGPSTDILTGINSVKIGKFSAIARKVSIQEYNHSFDRCSNFFMNANIFGGSYLDDICSKGSISIGNDVWIGANSTVLTGAQIGDGAVVGAGSIVTGVVAPYSIVGGVPAKVIRYRFEPEVIDFLQEISWWDWSISKIIKHKELFVGSLTIEKINYYKKFL